VKTLRKLFTSNSNYELTDEIYSELSLGQQLLAAMAEAAELENFISEYNGRYYVNREAIRQLWKIVFG
jgi:hypothetical protein